MNPHLDAPSTGTTGHTTDAGPSDARWAALRVAVNDRRAELGLGPSTLAERAGVSWEAVRALIDGDRRSRTGTRRAVSAALGWPPDAADRILAGDTIDDVLADTPPSVDRPEPVDPAGDSLAGAVRGLSPLDRQLVTLLVSRLAGPR